VPAEVRANEGSPEQLPRGAAKAANEQLEQARALAEGAPSLGAPAAPAGEEPEFVAPEDGEPDAGTTGDKEEEDFLFEDAPPDERDDGRGPGYGPVPQDVMDLLPTLVEASRDPSAPPQLTLLVQLLADRLEA